MSGCEVELKGFLGMVILIENGMMLGYYKTDLDVMVHRQSAQSLPERSGTSIGEGMSFINDFMSGVEY